MININVWSDFACPYCYIGEKRLCDAIKELKLENKVKVSYRAFELDPNALREGKSTAAERIASKYNMPLERAKAKVEEISRLGQEAGIKGFNYAGAIPSNTFDAHRVMKLAEAKYSEEVVHNLNVGLMDAYFVKNLVLGDWKVLRKVGEEAGMNGDEIDRMLETIDYGYEVRLDEDEARAMGVQGVPYFVVNNRLAIPGCISTENFADVLRKELENIPEDDSTTSTAKSCGPEGCAIG